MVAAAREQILPPFKQLKPGGIVVILVGDRHLQQSASGIKAQQVR